MIDDVDMLFGFTRRSFTWRTFLCVVLAFVASGWNAVASEVTFHVAPTGNNANDGTASAPFATIARARDAVRSWRKTNSGDATVILADGVYRLRETVVFDLRDTAPTGTTTIFRAADGARPILSAGWPVTGWKKLAQRPAGCTFDVWGAKLPSGIHSIKTLYDAQGPLPRAQEPGFIPSRTPNLKSPVAASAAALHCMTYPAGSVGADLDVTNAELNIVPEHPWALNILPLAKHDAASRTIVTAVPPTYRLVPPNFGQFPRGTAFIENTMAGMRKRGNWYVDRSSGNVYLIPRGETPRDDILAPILTELIRVEGKIDYEGARDNPVRGLAFVGLTFMHGDRWTWDRGKQGWGLQHDWELFDRPTAMVRLRGAEDCRFDRCRWAHSGATAIRFDLHCRRNSVRNSLIEHVGGVGVLLAGYGPGTKDVNRDNEVINCHIHHTSELMLSGPAVFVWQSGHNRIANNLIHDTPYTAVVISGRIAYRRDGQGECARTIRWHEIDAARGGEKPLGDWYAREPFMHARGNQLAFNEMHHTMQTLGDGNFVYVSGCGKDNVVRNNFMHDSNSYNINGNIRCDNDQHETLWENNVILRSTGEGLINKGKNTFRNNVFAAIRSKTNAGIENVHARGYIVMPSEIPQGAIYQRNVYLADERGRKILHHGKRKDRRRGGMTGGWLWECDSDYNVYWNTKDPNWAKSFFKEVRPKGSDRHSIAADPGFIDWQHGNFMLRPGAAARKVGFEGIDVTRCGLTDDFPVELR